MVPCDACVACAVGDVLRDGETVSAVATVDGVSTGTVAVPPAATMAASTERGDECGAVAIDEGVRDDGPRGVADDGDGDGAADDDSGVRSDVAVAMSPTLHEGQRAYAEGRYSDATQLFTTAMEALPPTDHRGRCAALCLRAAAHFGTWSSLRLWSGDCLEPVTCGL